jgi:hypothetical protein
MKLIKIILPVLLIVPGIAQAAAAAATGVTLTPTERLAEITKRRDAAKENFNKHLENLYEIDRKWKAAGKPSEGVLYTSLQTADQAYDVADAAYGTVLEELREAKEELGITEESSFLK